MTDTSDLIRRVRQRERAAAVFESIARLVDVLAWSPDDVIAETLDGDDEELEARLKAGPVLEAWQCVDSARFALSWSDDDAKDCIRSALIPWLP